MSPLARLIGYYLALYGTTGLWLPYLPVHLLALGFTGTQVAAITSVSAAATMVLPPVWGYLADRSGRGARLLAVTTTGWALALSMQLGARTFRMVLAAAVVQALFGTSLSSLADAQAVTVAQQTGTTFARLRLWGSVGFIATSLAFGQALSSGAPPWAVVPSAVAVAAMAVGFAWAGRNGVVVVRQPPTLGDVGALLRRRSLLMFMGAAALHWASFSPFSMFLATHLERATGSRAYMGPSLALAVGAEVLGMRYFEGLRRRAPLGALLGLSFALNAVRWWVLAGVQSGAVALAVQVIHGAAFGVFLVASVAFLEREVPPALRATGRALFGSIAFGLGGIGGHQLAGWIFDRHGTGAAFRASIVLEVLALLLLVLGQIGHRRQAPDGVADATLASC